MVSVLVEKPYEFIPPCRNDWWPAFIQMFKLFDGHLEKKDGVVGYELRNTDRLEKSLASGHGILLAPNHCRYADPLAMGWLARKVNTHLFAMASWHLFNMGGFNAFAIRKMGGFSIFREGLDRKSIETAIEVLVDAHRPLLLFPEGATFRANDTLEPLLDGVSFIARTAARRRAKKNEGKVLIHPIAIKYVFEGDIDAWANASLTRLEERLGWQSGEHLPLFGRIARVADGILALREIEYCGAANSGDFYHRQDRLIEAIFAPIEREWSCESEGTILNRIKALRSKIHPVLIEEISEQKKASMRRAMRDIETIQQLYSFPKHYLETPPVTETRVIETLENMEEGLAGKTSWPGPMKAIIDTGEPIEVPADKAPKNETDPLLENLTETLTEMLGNLAAESKLIQT